MKILLSREEFDKIFNFLDKNKSGNLTFTYFCAIVSETKSREIDVYKI